MEFHNIPYKVSHRAVKYPRLEFKMGELLVVLPFGHKPDVLLNKHKAWILKKSDFITRCLKNARGKKLIHRTDEEFKQLVHSLVQKTSQDLGVTLNHVYFRRMKTKWASLSSRNNMTVNRLMKYLPEHLVEYVVFHEVAHLMEKKHNGRFWHIISRKYQDYREIEKEMLEYWFHVVARHSLSSSEEPGNDTVVQSRKALFLS